MTDSQSSVQVEIVCIGKRKRANVISDSESDDGKTHSPVLKVDQLDNNDATFIQDEADDADEDKDNSKF